MTNVTGRRHGQSFKIYQCNSIHRSTRCEDDRDHDKPTMSVAHNTRWAEPLRDISSGALYFDRDNAYKFGAVHGPASIRSPMESRTRGVSKTKVYWNIKKVKDCGKISESFHNSTFSELFYSIGEVVREHLTDARSNQANLS